MSQVFLPDVVTPGHFRQRADGTMQHRVVILVAIYQGSQYLRAKLESLINQTIFGQSQVILLNCQNLENERSIYLDYMQTHHNLVEIRYEAHTTLYASWNDGIRTSQSEYLVNSNIDDLWHPSFLEESIGFLDSNQEYSVVSTRVMTTTITNQTDNWQTDGELPFYPYPESTAGPCPVWRRILHDKYGYFDGRCRSIGDAILWEKWLAGGEKFGLLDRPLVLYYRNPESLERRRENGVSLRDLDLKTIGRTC